MTGAGPSPAYPIQVTSSFFVSDCANRFSLRTCSGESRALNAACDSLAIGTVVLVELVELVELVVLVLDATVVEVVAVVV